MAERGGRHTRGGLRVSVSLIAVALRMQRHFWAFLGRKKALAVGLRPVGRTPFVTRCILLNMACSGRVLCCVCSPRLVLRCGACLIYTESRSGGTQEFHMDGAALTLPAFPSPICATLSSTAAAADFARHVPRRSSYRASSGIGRPDSATSRRTSRKVRTDLLPPRICYRL